MWRSTPSAATAGRSSATRPSRERIRRFVAGRLLQPELLALFDTTRLATLIASEIGEPTAAMAESYRALAPEHRSLLIALLDVPPGPVPERELAAAVRRHSARAFAHDPRAVLDRLSDHFVRTLDTGAVTWVHPSWRDLVIDQLVLDASARRAFLEACSVDGLLLALSTGGGYAGTRSLPLLLEDCDWDAAAERLAALVPDLDEPSTTRLLIALASGGGKLDRGPESWMLPCTLDLLKRPLGRTARPSGRAVGRWLGCALVPETAGAAGLAATWIEALPSHAAHGPVSDVELSDLREWLTLTELLAEHAPEQLLAFGFPERYYEVGSAAVARIRASADRIDDFRPTMRALSRLADLMPALADFAHSTIALVAEAQLYVLGGEKYWPRKIARELQELLDAPPAYEPSGKQVVEQVLRDL
jgi:hypothetical protein